MGRGWGQVVASQVERGERWTAVELDLDVADLKGVRGLWVAGKMVVLLADADEV